MNEEVENVVEQLQDEKRKPGRPVGAKTKVRESITPEVVVSSRGLSGLKAISGVEDAKIWKDAMIALIQSWGIKSVQGLSQISPIADAFVEMYHHKEREFSFEETT